MFFYSSISFQRKTFHLKPKDIWSTFFFTLIQNFTQPKAYKIWVPAIFCILYLHPNAGFMSWKKVLDHFPSTPKCEVQVMKESAWSLPKFIVLVLYMNLLFLSFTLCTYPDDVLIIILSFLTTKEVALTHVLSKIWSNLLQLVLILDFDESLLLNRKMGREPTKVFTELVERILFGWLKKLYLTCEIYKFVIIS